MARYIVTVVFGRWSGRGAGNVPPPFQHGTKSVPSNRRRGVGLFVAGCAAASLLVCVSAGPATATGITTCNQMCGNPCSIAGLKLIEPDADIDCSDRDITVMSTGNIKVQDGTFTLKAIDLTLNQFGSSGGNITAEDTGSGEPIGFDIELSGSAYILGALRANSTEGGGTIVVEAAGGINLPEDGNFGIQANGTAADADGGEIVLRADGNISITCPVEANGANSTETRGGEIVIEAGGIAATSVEGELRATGKHGGGGTIRIAGGLDNDPLTVGDVRIGAQILADGTANEGDGGVVYIEAVDAVEITAIISARGGVTATGGESSGGSIHIGAGCGGVDIDADLLMTGGEAGNGLDGGSLTIESLGDIDVASNVTLDAHSLANGGDGGSVRLRSKGRITLDSNSTIDASGHFTSGGQGLGAYVEVVGCTVRLNPGANIDARGFEGGAIRVDAQDLPAGPVDPSPMIISTSASLRAKAALGGLDGQIEMVVNQPRLGACTNDPTIGCVLYTDCQVGCETGQCEYANPDTGGQENQFDIEQESIEELGMGDDCASVCQ